ncbi:MAG: hypothetical protein ABI647_04130 [Gemmatimonadota bacterium]
MIRLAPNPLTPAERYGVDLLIDLSRLLPIDDPSANVTELEIVEDAGRSATLAAWVAPRGKLDGADGVVRLPRSMLQLVADIAGAGAEQRSTVEDRHGRVPSAENPLVQARLERDPVVSRLAAELRRVAVEQAHARPMRLLPAWPDGSEWAAAITHDLDAVEWWPLFTSLRLAELVRKGQLGRAGQVVGAALREALGDPISTGIRSLASSVAERNIRATWFLLCGTPSLRTIAAGDLTYRPEGPQTKAAIAAVRAGGHEIGLHGSFETGAREGEFELQRHRLGALTGADVTGVRQHFVKMRPGLTQRSMTQAGFTYDATYGFPDRNGFRLGVADIVPAWDERNGSAGTLMEVPLMWMDRALSKYRGIEQPDAWVDDALEIARTCRDVGGLWVGLWHPNLVPALGYPGSPRALVRLLDALSAMKPYWGTLADLTAWRRARRAVRARSIGADGQVVAVTAEPVRTRLRLLDAQGRQAEDVIPASRGA